MKKSLATILFVLFFTISANQFIYAQWYEITAYDSIFSDVQIYRKIQFVNETTGYLIGGPHYNLGLFQKTTDAGATWKQYPVSNVSTVRFWKDMHFLDEVTGFVAGYTNNIFKTTNGGLNWNSFAIINPSPENVQIESIFFINYSIGFAYIYEGSNGYSFRKTINGGETWFELPGSTMLSGSVKFINEKTGFVYGGNLFKTTNQGNNWQQINNVNWVRSISFINDNIGFLITNIGNTKNFGKTTNGGNTWTITNMQVQPELYDINFLNESTGFIFGHDIALKTIDGGNSWLLQNMNNSVIGGYRSSYFLNDNTGFVAGVKGKIYKTETSGTKIQNISSEIPSEFKISKTYPNPFNSQVNIEFEVPNNLTMTNKFAYEVYDIKGSLVKSDGFFLSSIGAYKLSIDFFSFNSGVYWIRILNGDKITPPQKLILIK